MMARFVLLSFILGFSSLGFVSSKMNVIEERNYYCPPDAEGFFPVGHGCTPDAYYCHDGVSYPQHCPCSDDIVAVDPALCPVFDPYTEGCVNPGECVPSSTTLPIPTTLRPFDCPYDGFFPVPESCTGNYYICINKVAFLQTCPNDAIFDPVTYTCEPNATCVNLGKPTECPPTYTGPYPYSPDACSSLYFYCTNGLAIAQYCPHNDIFLSDSLSCVPIENAPCTPGASPTTQSTTPSTAPETTTIITTTQSSTTTPTTTQTTTTTSTTQPTTTTSTTQPTTTTSTTQPTTTSTTQPTTITTTQPTTTTTTQPTTTTTTQPTTTTTTTQPTTTTTTTLPTTTSTTQPTTTTTTTQPTTTSTTQATTTTTTVTTTKDPFYFECPTPNGKFPYEGNCTLYWICVDSVGTLTQCPSDTGYNPITEKCELAFLVPNCNAKSLFQNNDAINKDFVCPADVGAFPFHPLRCASPYISCEMGIPFNKFCADGKVFDPLKLKCVQSQISSCTMNRAKLAKIYGLDNAWGTNKLH